MHEYVLLLCVCVYVEWAGCVYVCVWSGWGMCVCMCGGGGEVGACPCVPVEVEVHKIYTHSDSPCIT